ncbi:MAG: hypothetical protein R2873_10280 [Caldilineaceae bacterium]
MVTATTNRSVNEASQLSITDIATFNDAAWTDATLGASETFTYSIDWGDGSRCPQGRQPSTPTAASVSPRRDR